MSMFDNRAVAVPVDFEFRSECCVLALNLDDLILDLVHGNIKIKINPRKIIILRL